MWSEISQLPVEGSRLFNTSKGLIVLPYTSFGPLLYSLDGLGWTSVPLDTRTYLSDIAEGGGMLMGVGEGFRGTSAFSYGVVYTATNGTEWTRRDRGTRGLLDDIIFGGGKFVAVGGLLDTRTTVAVSVDGKEWTDSSLDTTNKLRRVAYGNGTYVIITRNNGRNPPAPIYTSGDAITWMRHDDTANIKTFLNGITYGAGKFVAVGFSNTVAHSTDGRIWESDPLHDRDGLWSVAYGNGVFVAVGDKDFGSTQPYADNIMTSADGVNWVHRTSGKSIQRMRTISFGNGRFVAVGDATSITSIDGVTWETHSFPYQVFAEKMTFADGRFMMATRYSSSSGESFHDVFSSPDGVSWTRHTTGSSLYLWSLAYGANTLVVAADLGTILQSDPFPLTGSMVSLVINYLENRTIELSLSSSDLTEAQIFSTTDISSNHWEPLGTIGRGGKLIDVGTAAFRFYEAVISQ